MALVHITCTDISNAKQQSIARASRNEEKWNEKKLFWAFTETVWLHHKPPDKDYRIVKYNQHGKIFNMYIKNWP